MVFSSFPIYIDPPNWHQQPNQHLPNGSSNSPLSALPQSEQPDVRVEPAGPIKSGSTLDQAKMAPQEGALKCPRCESTNTKFCYFNNYNLSQPRHFCKTCRRYWTKGGALRNVPVGGGCRRNKKNKRRRSKSPVSTKKPPISSSSTSELIARFQQPFMASLQNMTRYGVGNNSLSLREVEAQNMGFQIGGHGSSSDQWWFQQFPNLLNGFESVSCSLLQSESAQGLGVDVAATSPRVTQIPAPVKLEYNNGGLNFSLNNVSENNNLYHSWTDLSAHASSSASHLL